MSSGNVAWYTLTVEDANRIVLEHNAQACNWLAFSDDIHPAGFTMALSALVEQSAKHGTACREARRGDATEGRA